MSRRDAEVAVAFSQFAVISIGWLLHTGLRQAALVSYAGYRLYF